MYSLTMYKGVALCCNTTLVLSAVVLTCILPLSERYWFNPKNQTTEHYVMSHLELYSISSQLQC